MTNTVMRLPVHYCIIGICLFTSASSVFAKESLNNESSIVLVDGAWEALKNDDLAEVIRLTDQCIDRYGELARQMQNELGEYVTGTKDMIMSKRALNDVATAFYIQGKAFQNAKRYDEAKSTYQKLVNNYAFGQCWDPKGWFWKPAVVAKENITMIETGIFYDFGDYASSTLVTRAWEALSEENLTLVLGYTDKCIQLYEERAREMQNTLTDFPSGSDEDLFRYWALNDIATAHFIRGKAYVTQGRTQEAIKEFEMVRDHYSYGQCWDPRGWWWKVVNESNDWLEVLIKKESSK